MASLIGFLLTRHWRDGPGGVALLFWAHSSATPLRLVFTGQRGVCCTPADTALDPAETKSSCSARPHTAFCRLPGAAG
jgi:hypothetical protein